MFGVIGALIVIAMCFDYNLSVDCLVSFGNCGITDMKTMFSPIGKG